MQLPDSPATLAALLLAVNPGELKGAVLRGSRRDCERWIEQFHAHDRAAPMRRLSPNIPEERLLGGLDFAATISRGHAVYERGVLALSDSGCVVLPAASTQRSTWQHVSRALDEGAVAIERDGFSDRHQTTFAAIATEESPDESCSAAFATRVAFCIELAPGGDAIPSSPGAFDIPLLRARVPQVRCDDKYFIALTEGAAAMGVHAVRAVLLAIAAARTIAAVRAHADVSDDDMADAARLVLSPRATVFEHEERDVADRAEQAPDEPRNPSPDEPAADQLPTPDGLASDEQPQSSDDTTNDGVPARALADLVVVAVKSALPPGLLLTAAARAAGKSRSAGRAGEDRATGNRGRQIGTRRGDPRGGARLDIVATLRAAIPWQRFRRSARASGDSIVRLSREDFRVKRCVTPGTTTTLFVVDASGSSALHRLNEVKGAVELMLAEGYARRDRVALIAFRGTTAQLLLPPTHALTRARRAIAGMPAGGGTPMATALDLTVDVVQKLKRDSGQTVVVILSDGQANVGRDGSGGRAKADADAMEAATRLGYQHDRIVWIDSSQRANAQSKRLAETMNARYIALPMATATGLSGIAKMAIA